MLRYVATRKAGGQYINVRVLAERDGAPAAAVGSLILTNAEFDLWLEQTPGRVEVTTIP